MKTSESMSRSMRTTSYLLRLTPEEKTALEAKAAEIAAQTGRRCTLANALREGARLYLDDLAKLAKRAELDDQARDVVRLA
jgi:hypothetical protein